MEDLKNITKEKKQKYMRGMIESIYVRERSSAVVNGYIPLAIQAQNIQYESICRNSQDGNKLPGSNNHLEPEPTFFEDKVIPFQFTFKMPPPNIARMILERDEKGRIMKISLPI